MWTRPQEALGMKARAATFASNDHAAITTEAGLVVAGIALAITSVVLQIGPQIGQFIEGVVARLGG
jgi:hypothetical protein